jgi:hypothetical protein
VKNWFKNLLFQILNLYRYSEAETLAAERDAAISQLGAAVEENKRLQAENIELQFYKGMAT